MVKPNLHIIVVLIACMLSMTAIAQTKNQNTALLSVENNNEIVNDLDNNIIVISIFNNKNHEEIKKLNMLAEKYITYNVKFISVTDNLNDEGNLLKNQVLHYQRLSKVENKRVFNKYQTGMYKVFPIHLVINKEGEVIYKRKGTVNNIEEKLAKRINKLLESDSNKIQAQELQYTSR